MVTSGSEVAVTWVFSMGKPRESYFQRVTAPERSSFSIWPRALYWIAIREKDGFAVFFHSFRQVGKEVVVRRYGLLSQDFFLYAEVEMVVLEFFCYGSLAVSGEVFSLEAYLYGVAARIVRVVGGKASLIRGGL